MSKAKALFCAAAIVGVITASRAQAEAFKYRPWLPEHLNYVACIYDHAGDEYELSQASCKSTRDKILEIFEQRSALFKNSDRLKSEKYLNFQLNWTDNKPKPGSLDAMFEGFEHLTAIYLRCVSGVIANDPDFKAGKKVNAKLATNFCKAEFVAVGGSMQSAKLRRRAQNDVGAWRGWIESSGIEYGQFGDGVLARPDEPVGPATYTGEP